MAHKTTVTVTIGFEAKLWLIADKLRNNMGAAEWSPSPYLGITSHHARHA